MTQPNKQSKSEIISLIYVILIALVIRSLVVELFFVPTGSMKLSILEGDYILSTKYSYGYSRYSASIPLIPNKILDRIFTFQGRIFENRPERGDVVIFRPPLNMDILYIKRLVGLPGEKIQIIDNVIYINDKPIERKEIGIYNDSGNQKYKKFLEILPNGKQFYSYQTPIDDLSDYMHLSNTEAFYIPQDHYFFLGDNRNNSRDSRYELGYVPFVNLVSKARFIIFSTEEILWNSRLSFTEQIENLWKWLVSIRINRILQTI